MGRMGDDGTMSTPVDDAPEPALPALSEIVGSGDDARGAVFTAGDASSLADVLGRLAGDPAERDRLGAAARAWVVAHRRWADNGPRYAEIIRNL